MKACYSKATNYFSNLINQNACLLVENKTENEIETPIWSDQDLENLSKGIGEFKHLDNTEKWVKVQQIVGGNKTVNECYQKALLSDYIKV